MHWHAIRRSKGSHGSSSLTESTEVQSSDALQESDAISQSYETVATVPFGHDDAADTCLVFRARPAAEIMKEETVWMKDDELPKEDEDEFLPVPIPFSSSGLTTSSYQLALQNRLQYDKLTQHGEYDTTIYKPTFIHDCMMQPGSLANLIGKGSSEDIVSRMTPALLPGFHPHVHAETQLPCILQSPSIKDYVQGMVIFGQGKRARRLIHSHYSADTRRVTVDVEIDVAVPVSAAERDFPTERWRLMRRTVSAHAWIWSNVASDDVQFRSLAPRWTLEDYISGSLAPVQSIRIEGAGWWSSGGDSIGRKDDDVKQEEREIIYGGPGLLDYERGTGFTGW